MCLALFFKKIDQTGNFNDFKGVLTKPLRVFGAALGALQSF